LGHTGNEEDLRQDVAVVSWQTMLEERIGDPFAVGLSA
jgi:hypothetical protein